MSSPAHVPHHLSDAAVALVSDTRLRESLGLVVPEIILAATILAVVVYDMFFRREESFKSGVLALAGVGGAWLAALASMPPPGMESAPMFGFGGAYIADGLTRYFRLLFLLATMIVVFLGLLSKEINRYRQGEFHAILLTATLAICLLAGAGDMILFFLALETLSLSSYVLAGFAKDTRAGTEASLKYLLYGSMMSGILLFGFSYLYGLSGTSRLPEMLTVALSGPHSLIAVLGLLLILAGLFFKTSVAPFHVWTPDVYQGAPAPVTAYLSVASKAAGFAALARVALPVINLEPLQAFREAPGDAIGIDLRFVFGLLAVVTMTIGNFGALRQRDFKRLLAYSSIAHAGYMLMAFSNPTVESVAAMMAYLKVYLFMNMGFFLAVVLMENDHRLGSDNMDDYAGYGRQNPALGACLVVILVSLVGLPPTAGFSAKFSLFASIVRDPHTGALLPWHTLLVIAALLNSVVSLTYYIRPAKILFFDDIPANVSFDGTAHLGASYKTLATLGLLAMTLPLFALLMWWGEMGLFDAVDALRSSALVDFLPSGR